MVARAGRATPKYFANMRDEEGRRNLAAWGHRARSAASTIYPHLSTNSRAVANLRPKAAKPARPKSNPRVSVARRLWPDWQE
jgi:hypothetical protein